MTPEIDPTDGLDLTAQDYLAMARSGLTEPEATAEEFGEALAEFPVDGRIEPTDRGLILVALSQDEANETARILQSKFEAALARNPLL